MHPPRWLFLLLLAGLVGHYLSPAGSLPHGGILKLLGTLSLVLGFSIMLWAWKLFQQEQNEIHPLSETNKAFIVSGPYRFTRNPMYLGMIFILGGVAFFLGTLPMFVSMFVLFLILDRAFIPFEEVKMKKLFGEAYENYVLRVRRWL